MKMTLSASDQLILGSDLYAHYPNTLVFSRVDINSDVTTDIIFVLRTSDSKSRGLAVFSSSDGSLPSQPKIVGSDFFAQFLNGFVELHDLNGDYKQDLLFVGRASIGGGPLQKFAFYPYLSGGYSDQPQILASDLLALYTKTNTFSKFQQPNGTSAIVIDLLRSDGVTHGSAVFQISDLFFTHPPTLIGQNLDALSSRISLLSTQDLNNDGYPDLLFKLSQLDTTPVGLAIFMSSDGFFSDNGDIIGSDLYAKYPPIDMGIEYPPLSISYLLRDFQKNGHQDLFFSLVATSQDIVMFGLSRISDGHYANQPYNLVSSLVSDYPHTSALLYPNKENTLDFIFLKLIHSSYQTAGWAFLDLTDDIASLSFQIVGSDLLSAYPQSSSNNALTWLNAAGELSIGIQLTDSDSVTHGLAIYAPSDRNYTHLLQILGSDINSTLYPFSHFELQSSLHVNGLPIISCTLQDAEHAFGGIIFYGWSDGLFREVMKFSNSALLLDFPDTVINSVFQDSDQIVAILDLGYSYDTSCFNGLIVVYEHPTSTYPDGYQIIDGNTVPLNEFSTVSTQNLSGDGAPEIIIDSSDTLTSSSYAIIFDFSDRRYNPFPRFTETDWHTPSHISYSCLPTLSDMRFYGLSNDAFKVTGYQSNNLPRQRFVSASYLSHPVQTQSFDSDGFFEFDFNQVPISDGATVVIKLYQDDCFCSDEKSIVTQTQTQSNGKMHLQFSGSLLDFSLTLPPGLSVLLSLSADVHTLLSDICTYAHTQSGETFIAGLTVNNFSDVFCSNALIVNQPNIVDISCSDDTLYMNEVNGEFTFSISHFLSDNIVMQYDASNCHSSDGMSLIGGGFTLTTNNSDHALFVWSTPCNSSDTVILINTFDHPLLTIDAEGHIGSVGTIDTRIAHNETSDIMYASRIKASVTKLGNYFSAHFSDYSHLISDKSYLLYKGALMATSVMVDLDACQMLFQDLSVPFSDIDICQ